MSANEVNSILEMLLEELEKILLSERKKAAQAIEKGKYESSEKISRLCQEIENFEAKVKLLKKEWKQIDRLTRTKKNPPVWRRAEPGEKTHEDCYREPLLISLLEMGGSASVRDVLDQVYDQMKDKLKPIDFEPVPSRKSEIRWCNTAKWCRKTLTTEGLLSSQSPRGIWELTEQGREEAKRLLEERNDSRS